MNSLLHSSVIVVFAVIWVSRYQNVSIVDIIGANGDGGGGNNKSYKMCKAPVKSSTSTNRHPVFYRPDALPVAVCCPCSIVGRCAPLYLCHNPASILQCADNVPYQKLHLLLETCTVTRTCRHPQPSHCSCPPPHRLYPCPHPVLIVLVPAPIPIRIVWNALNTLYKSWAHF